MRESLALEPLGQARVRVFWGGVYHSFAVCGPAKFYLRVARNASFNTILCSVMLDKVSGPPTEFETKYPGLHSVYFFTKKYDAYIAAPNFHGVPAPLLKLWSDIGVASCHRVLCPLLGAERLLCYRALSTTHAASEALLAWWRRSLPMATDKDRMAFAAAIADMYADELKLVPNLNRKDL